MSLEGQVDCQRMLGGPAWPLAIMGKPSVAAPAVAAAAPARNLRREAVSVFCSLLIGSSFRWCSWMVGPGAILLIPGTFCGKRFVGFPPRAPRACTRQSPRIVFLVRPEIKLVRAYSASFCEERILDPGGSAEVAKQVLLAFGIILLTGTLSGFLAQKIKIPDVVVFLLARTRLRTAT